MWSYTAELFISKSPEIPVEEEVVAGVAEIVAVVDAAEIGEVSEEVVTASVAKVSCNIIH